MTEDTSGPQEDDDDPDADPGMMNPRDTRGETTPDDEDPDADPDADPGNLNPRDG